MRLTNSIIAGASSLMLTGVASADVLHVPGEYATIQAAIDAAADGDEIELAAGDYIEDIRIIGKALRIRPADPYPQPGPAVYPVILSFDGYTDLTDLIPDEARTLEIIDVTDGEVIFEGIHFDFPFDRDRDLATTSIPEAYSEVHISNSNVAFEFNWISGGGGNYLPAIIFQDAAVRMHRCYSTSNSGSGPFYFQLVNSDFTISDSTMGDTWHLLNPPLSQSSVSITGTEFEDGRGLNRTGVFVRGFGFEQTPRDLPDGYTLPEITVQDCTIPEIHTLWFRGDIFPGGSFLIDGLASTAGDSQQVEIDIAIDGGTAEIRNADFPLSDDDFGPETPRLRMSNEASVTIADTTFRGMRARGVPRTLLLADDVGDITIERTQFLPYRDDEPAIFRLIDGACQNLIIRDVLLPSLGSFEGIPSGYTTLTGSSLQLENAAAPTIPDDNPDFAPPTFTFTSLNGTADISGSTTLDIVLENCSAFIDNASINSLSMDPSRGLDMIDSTVSGGEVFARGGHVAIQGGSLIDSGLHLLDADASVEGLVTVRGKMAVYAERSTIDLAGCAFLDTNRGELQPSDGGVLIVHDSELSVHDCEIHGGGAANNNPSGSPYNTPSGVIGASGTSDVRAWNLDIADCWASSGGLFSARDTASIEIVNASIRACGAENGPLIANARPGSTIAFRQVLVSGNESSDTTINQKSMAREGPNAELSFHQCTIWHNTVIGNPYDGDIDFIGSLVEGVTAFSPSFISTPDDGGDGWYNSRSQTPSYDESANNDYGDLRLLAGSPAIDAGDSSLLPADTFDLDNDGDTTEPLPIDLDGNPRVVDDPATPDTGPVSPAVDLGAYEFQPAACIADLNGDGVLNFDDIDAFVAGFLGGDLIADLDGNGVLNFDDIEAFVAGFIAGCG